MRCKWSLLGVHGFYTKEQALTILTNMSDFEDESTSESENKGDSSDSSEYTPEQHQVRTNSNIQTVMPKETKVSKAKEIPKKGQKAASKPVDNQSATKCALLADQTATTSGEEHVASPPNVSKAKEISKKGQKAASKLVDNQSVTKHTLLADQTATTSGEEHVASPPNVSKAKEISKKGQKAAPKLVDNQSATKHALLADQTATTSGEEHVASPPNVSKVSKAKEIPKKGQKAAPKLVDNQSATKHALLADQTATTPGEEHVASPPKVSKAKEIPSQKAAPKLVDNQSITKAMASNSDMDVEVYYIVEDANESASSEYVPCINYANDKVYPEDKKNGWVKVDQDTGPPNIYRFDGSC